MTSVRMGASQKAAFDFLSANEGQTFHYTDKRAISETGLKTPGALSSALHSLLYHPELHVYKDNPGEFILDTKRPIGKTYEPSYKKANARKTKNTGTNRSTIQSELKKGDVLELVGERSEDGSHIAIDESGHLWVVRRIIRIVTLWLSRLELTGTRSSQSSRRTPGEPRQRRFQES